MHLRLIMLMTLFFSCTTGKHIPISELFKDVEVYSVREGEKNTNVLADDPRFKAVENFLIRREHGWIKPFGTYPTPHHTVAFDKDDEQLVFPLWIGESWIGLRYKNTSYLLNLSESELDSVHMLFNIH